MQFERCCFQSLSSILFEFSNHCGMFVLASCKIAKPAFMNY
uniref:Uncharacterized protein n=1 Tax=Onchocerca volvulus TaxID=6282 RepID=A0A8R1TUD3_ONCVO